MKIVLNKCPGGFSLSEAAIKLGRALSGEQFWGCDGADCDEVCWPGACECSGRLLDRTDPVLAHVVGILGDRANGYSAKLAIENVPHGDKYRIVERDGHEHLEFPGDIVWQTADGEEQRLWDLKQFQEGEASNKLVTEFLTWHERLHELLLNEPIHPWPTGWRFVDTSHD
jgi:hypothetical protein